MPLLPPPPLTRTVPYSTARPAASRRLCFQPPPRASSCFPSSRPGLRSFAQVSPTSHFRHLRHLHTTCTHTTRGSRPPPPVLRPKRAASHTLRSFAGLRAPHSFRACPPHIEHPLRPPSTPPPLHSFLPPLTTRLTHTTKHERNTGGPGRRTPRSVGAALPSARSLVCSSKWMRGG